jgi:hypothetical protein
MRKAATTLIAAYLLAILTSTLVAAASDLAGSVAHARRLIEAKDHGAAVAVLEDALVEAESKDRPAIVQLLRESYAALAKQAEAAGNKRAAEHYRDNLAILNRDQAVDPCTNGSDDKPKAPAPVKPVAAAPPSGPLATLPALDPLPAKTNDTKAARSDSTFGDKIAPKRQPAPPAASPIQPQAASSPNASAESVDGRPVLSVEPAANPPAERASERAARPPSEEPKPLPPKATVQEADRLFRDKKYREAGKCYAELARESRLPANRKDHWGYCRYVALVEWINNKPRSQREWDQIAEERESIERLAPKLWYGEYLRTLIAEARRKGPQGLPHSDNLVVRGSAPDDSEPKRFSRLFGKLKSRTESRPQAVLHPSPPAGQSVEQPSAASGLPPAALEPLGQNEAETGPSAGAADPEAPNRALEPLDVDSERPPVESRPSQSDGWQLHETANFRIFHRDARLAAAAGQTAEEVRALQGKQWGSDAAAKRWSPACEIYLYPSGKALAKATQQPENSPGFSTMTSDGARVVARRVNLRADHPQLLAAILPHEITHVVLADIFTAQQIPRWADEGLAVMAEPRTEQQLRWAELQEPLKTGRIFKLDDLMAMDYPDPKDWSLYYAQSVSLTRFLVEQDSPERFIRFVLDSHDKGAAAALEASYRIKGFDELKTRWTDYALKQIAPATATTSTRDGSDKAATATR